VRPSTQPHGSVHVDRVPCLELHHLREGDPRAPAELVDTDTAGRCEAPLQSDQEPSPQLVGVELPHDVGQVVVALPAQRLTDARVGLVVTPVAPQSAPVEDRWADHVAVGTVRDVGQRVPGRGGRGHRHEGARPLGHRCGDALPAHEPAGEDVPRVASYALEHEGQTVA
jgi:hypothetical protein